MKINRTQIGVGIIAALTLTAVAVFAAVPHLDPMITWAQAQLDTARVHLAKVPWWLFCIAFCLIPGGGFPLTFFYIATPGIIGNLWMAVPFAMFCVWVNASLSYLVGRFFFRQWAGKILEHRKIQIPTISAQNEASITILCRISPTPWALQSLVLAIAGVSYRSYAVYTLTIQCAAGCTLMIGGDSALKGNWMLVIIALGLFAGLSLLFSRWSRGKQADPVPAAE